MTRRLLISAGMILLLATASAAEAAAVPANERSYEFSETATTLFNQGKYRAAIVQLKNAIQQDARNVTARILLGRAYLRLGDGELAERELLAARRMGAHPDLVVVPLGRAYLLQRKYGEVFSQIRPGYRGKSIEAAIQDIRGSAYLALRNYEEADKAFAAASRYQPRLAYPLLGRARVQSLLGKPQQAERYVDRAIHTEPGNSDAWFEKGELQRRKRNYAQALESYGKAISLQPHNIPARLSRAAILIRLKRDSEALSDIEFVRTNAPREARASYLYAQVLTREGATNDAQAILAEAEQLLQKRSQKFVRNDLSSLLLLGVIGYARGNYADSFRYLSRYLELDPTHPGARKLLGSMLLKKGDAWGAISMLRPALVHAPQDTGILTLLGNAYMRLKQYAEASIYLEKAVKLSPGSAALRTQLGISRIGAGQTAKAENDFEAALKSRPDGSRPDLLLGLLYLKQGNYDKAEQTAKEIVRADPANPFAFNLAGAVQMGRHNLKAARAEFEKALQVKQDYTPALFNLAKLDMAEGKVDDARARYAAILRMRPKNIKAMNGLADIALASGKPEEAVKLLQQITVIRPNAIRPAIKILNIYLRQNRVDAALGLAQSLEIAHPSDPLVVENIGRVLLIARKYSAAAAKFRRLVQLAGDDAAKMGRIARLQEQARDAAGARDTLNQAIKLEPGSFALQSARIRLEARQNNIDRALKLARALRKTAPRKAVVDLMIGDLLMGNHSYKDAVRSYTAAMAQGATSQIVRRLYEAKRLNGQKEEGLTLLTSWVAGHPRDLLAQRLLATAYRQNGRLDEAIAVNERLLQRLPNDPALLNNLAGLYQKKGDSRALPYAKKAYSLRPQHWATMDTYGWLLVLDGQPEKGLNLLRQAFTRAADNPQVRYHLAVALNRTGRRKEARAELEQALDSGTDFDGIGDAKALLAKLRGG